MKRAVQLGAGQLTWSAEERRSDRYGYVFLSPATKPLDTKTIDHFAGLIGLLVCVVTGTRQSEHIGDLFHGVYPRMPAVGQVVVLGEGELSRSGDTVGLMPEDGRATQWLSMRSLYDVIHQDVELYFEVKES